MGAIGGGIFQAVKGFRNAPVVSSPNRANKKHSSGFKTTSYSLLLFQGVGHRLRGSANAVRIRAPQIGGKAVIKVSHSGAGIIH